MSIDDNKEHLYNNLAPLNKAALLFFVLAKLFGFCGVSLGFLESAYRRVGGVVLVMAIFFIFCSITCAIIQGIKDKKIFQEEDEKKLVLKTLSRRKKELELEIRKLEKYREEAYSSVQEKYGTYNITNRNIRI